MKTKFLKILAAAICFVLCAAVSPAFSEFVRSPLEKEYFCPSDDKELELGDVFIYISLDKMRLMVFVKGESSNSYWLKREYKVAIGEERYPTPTGFYKIHKIEMKPDWGVPKSTWVTPEYRKIAKENNGVVPYGYKVNGDDVNPMGECKIWLVNIKTGLIQEFLIHGAGGLTVGTRVSHSCIRLMNKDILDMVDYLELVEYSEKDTLVIIQDQYPYADSDEEYNCKTRMTSKTKFIE